ncbi:MAG: hypothetical protein F6K42_08985 [Leptolyngbya sp. SIO1D8]|nr:hypothetical protein [Leptolyngbya sp. SIO1D8]
MSSSRKRSRRRRGVVLSLQGWQRLQAAQQESELADNGDNRYSVEQLAELTGLSVNSLGRVRSLNTPVDRQTLEAYFTTFSLTLTPADYQPPPSEEDPPETKPPETDTSETDVDVSKIDGSETRPSESLATTVPASFPAASQQQDWGEAIDVSIFHGRSEELATLGQ